MKHASIHALHVTTAALRLRARYKWAKACCGMQVAAQLSAASLGASPPPVYECTDWRDEGRGWHTDLPAGDAVLGSPWEHDGADTGSYNLTAELGAES